MILPEKIFALRRLPVLAGLSEPELAVLAEATSERRYPAGALVTPAGRLPARVSFVCEGAVRDAGGRDLGSAPGAAALLANRPPAAAWHAAGPSGAVCLQITRNHLFTVARQCPAFVVALLGERLPSDA